MFSRWQFTRDLHVYFYDAAKIRQCSQPLQPVSVNEQFSPAKRGVKTNP
jgi:hypothetical protein